ncbi:GNAT family N-acetyltransferase [Pseudarthrobacter sp. N5]|uniref:GNAT family N-acetyltransferase n=1 Tax=Pseudarthrobacter sp. N5 TaxID=3418416 RepID=UPI003CEDCECC
MSFTFRCLDAAADAPLLHSWVTRPYASFWGMLSSTVQDVVEEYSTIQSSGHHHALLGLDDGVPAFLMEEYLPGSSPLAAVYAVQSGDIGMHLLVAPPSGVMARLMPGAVPGAVAGAMPGAGPEFPAEAAAGGVRPGFTTAVMEAVLDRLFQKPCVERVVVEPGARNSKIHALNERLGFQPAGVVTLPDKEALLSFCTRADFHAARSAISQSPSSQFPIPQAPTHESPTPRERHYDHHRP